MRRSLLVAALILAPAALAAQQPIGVMPSPSPVKPVRFQVFGGMSH